MTKQIYGFISCKDHSAEVKLLTSNYN